ncbi:hypothetical protein [Desulfopila sp. IMCC35008]|uniref:hypothetical protein n=1 Tax=Desulfopila sp. IMCC35008 TaxID=2653858 RepID=UPI0013D38BC3|nr:hypothetical protein [Desulfopila sp. IMCC35008]
MKNKKFTFSSLNMNSTILRVFHLLVGVMMVITGCSKLYYYVDFRLMGVEIFGVIEHPATTTVLGGRPLIRYEDALGKIHEFRSKAKTHWFTKPQKGEALSIIYKKAESQRAIVNNLLYYVIWPMGFIVVGCFFLFQAIHLKNGLGFLPAIPLHKTGP